MTRSLIACAVLLFAGAALAAELPPPPPPPPPPRAADVPSPPPPPPPPSGAGEMALGPAGRALHEIDLTAAQRREVRELVERHRREGLDAAFRAVHEARRVLELQVWEPDAGEAELARAEDALADAEGRVTGLRRRLAAELLALMDADQRAAFGRALREPRWGGPRP